jgi:uncharacterized phage protein gp47/JayE
MFHVKDFLSITAGMLNHIRATTRKLTDFTVGSVTRTLLEATAVEIDRLYQQMLRGLLAAIPVAIYRSFGFDTIPAVPASGLVRLTLAAPAAAPLTVPQGAVLATAAGLQYLATAAATIAAGELSATVLVSAAAAGPQGNILPGEIVRLVSPALSPVAVANPAAFTNGRGEETAEERRQRFVEYIRALARGTVASCIYAAKTVSLPDPVTGLVLERVSRATVEETAGHVTLFIHNGAGATSADLVTAVQRKIDGWRDPASGAYAPGYRPAGMRVDVRAMAETAVDVELRVQTDESRRTSELDGKIAAAVSAVIRATVSGGGSGLLPIDMVNAILALADVSGAEILSPTLVTPCGLGQVLAPGRITVAWSS